MLMLIYVTCCFSQTTTNTCSNDPLISKLDIRQRIKDSGNDSTISSINVSQLCYETREYDYIWLSQMWIPSKYNYRNQFNIEQTYDYRDFESIKEYEFDPDLGTLQEFANFIRNFRTLCIHIKFLGEFSFYIGQDSSLLSNQTRFLRRPQDISYNDQNMRYDDHSLVWAINSQGKTIPYTAVWNYFQYSIFMDMKDILENKIIQQYSLDGVIFLQPSLGLFEVIYTFYPTEIDFYGDPTFMRDFYKNYKDMNTKIYLMGDGDNIRAKPILLNAGLQQVFNPLPNTNEWLRLNYTFNQSADFCQNDLDVSELHINVAYSGAGYVRYCLLPQPLTMVKQCIKFNFTVKVILLIGCLGYLIWHSQLPINQNPKLCYKSKLQKNDIFSMDANGGRIKNLSLGIYNYFDKEKNSDPGVGFSIKLYDIIEIQFDGQSNELIFRKTNTSIFRYQWLDIQYDQFRFSFGLAHTESTVQISFPYQFTNDLKSTYLKKNGDLHIQSIKNSTALQIGQVLQSINQYENTTQLNIYALSVPAASTIALGVCNKDLMIINKHQVVQNINSGGYLLLSNGSLIHSNEQYNNQTSLGFNQGDLISVIFFKQNHSVAFKKNNSQIYSIAIGQFVKNLHFCVGFYQQFQAVSLQY